MQINFTTNFYFNYGQPTQAPVEEVAEPAEPELEPGTSAKSLLEQNLPLQFVSSTYLFCQRCRREIKHISVGIAKAGLYLSALGFDSCSCGIRPLSKSKKLMAKQATDYRPIRVTVGEPAQMPNNVYPFIILGMP